METAIKDVLESAVMAGNITTDQSHEISEELTSAFVAKEKNMTLADGTDGEEQDSTGLNRKVAAQLETLKSSVAHVESKCKDQMHNCKRFKDAGICPFVGTFMNGACAKTCNSCTPKAKSSMKLSYFSLLSKYYQQMKQN